MLFIDADACPVRSEAIEIALRHKTQVALVSNGGIRPVDHALVRNVYVDQGADAADIWIAEHSAKGDIVVTNDIVLAARVISQGAQALRPDGEILHETNIGQVLAMRDLAADLRAADPFRQGGGKPFSKSDRARFRDSLDRLIRRNQNARLI